MEVLFVHADGKLSVGADVNAKVSAEIVDQVAGDKVIAFKPKKKGSVKERSPHSYTKLK